jgi:hypothetical protein
MTLRKSNRLLTLLVLAAIAGASLCLAQQQSAPQAGATRTLAIDREFNLRYRAPWTTSGVKYTNAQELVVTKQVPAQEPGRMAESVLARVLITTEPRSSHEDAIKRLQDIAASRPETARFVEIGGWPAVELEFKEPLPRRGSEQGEGELQGPTPLIQRAITAIAMENRLVKFDTSLAPDAPPDLLQQAYTITRSAQFIRRANPEAVRQTIQRLQTEEVQRKAPQRPPGEVRQQELQNLPQAPQSTTGTVRVQAGFGELEIAASPGNALNIVLASNAALSFSTNRGATFTAGNTGVFGLNDPTLARGASANFYLGVIAIPTGTTAQLNVTGCTNAVSRSTNNGSTFALMGYSARCPSTGTGLCFPDQEHIAADAVNTAAGNDQLYAVWRNFTPAPPAPATCGGIGRGFVTASITCSQNNGTTWTATAAIPGAGDFPRVAVGRDGNVYVTTVSGNSILLNRFTSCANGLTAATGFPVTVATMNGAVTCPVPGLDRCNDGNTLSSPTPAPDPDNATHIFVTFAENDGSGGERIVTMESTNSGASFPGRTTVNGGSSARRFMPWSCTARGRAWVGWYDRSAAVGGGSNDRTDYFFGSAPFGSAFNLTNNPDPQCASGWACSVRNASVTPPGDSESCSVQPQLAGRCSVGGAACDFSAGCPPGQGMCQGGGGCPKYGDYNGVACAGDSVVAAWASATAPAGLPAAAGIGVYSTPIFLNGEGAAIWRYTGTPCTGSSCPGWQRLDNNPKTVSIASSGNQLYQLHNDGWIWRYTGTPCTGDFCPGWQRLDNNSKTVAIAVGGGQLYQLHNDGWIWRHTGVPCSGNSCPGWMRLDNNSKTIAIAAANQLYQLHNDGRIWRFTGTPCSGNSCPGWVQLDNNPKTVGIAATGNDLYQIHNDGLIWRFTGTVCSGNSCPGWQLLDNNPATVAIMAADQLYQLHNTGLIWRFTGTPCSGNSCPGWQLLDNNSKTVTIAGAGNRLYQLHVDGWIWQHTGTPCSGNSCPGWRRLDNNPRTGMIVAGDELYQLHTDPLYQLHNDGWIWRYTGYECDAEFCPGWERLDNNPATDDIVAAGAQLFQHHTDGTIWRYVGTPCSGNSCPGWQMLDNNPATKSIDGAGNQLFQLHNSGRIWRYTGVPCSGNSCPSWQMLDNNPATVAIAAAGNQLFQLHSSGRIWRYLGTPCSGNSCPSWQMLDNNPATKAIAAAGNQLFQLHNSGRIWRYTGTPCSGNSCPGWQMLDNNPKTVAITAGGAALYQLHNDGWIWRYSGTPCSGNSCPGWERLDNNPKTKEIIAIGDRLYQRHNDGWIWRYTGPPCSGTSCPGWRRLDNNPKTKQIIVSNQGQ